MKTKAESGTSFVSRNAFILCMAFFFSVPFVSFGAGPAFSDEPGLSEPAEATGKYIRILSPEGKDVYEEGEICTIRWESLGVDKVHISVATGGKDKGLLEDDEGRATIDAKQESFEWTIPDGFITAFGPEKSENVRVMVFDTEDFETRDMSGFFTVLGKTAVPSKRNSGGKPESPWVNAIEEFYGAIGEGRYTDAYEMLCDCEVLIVGPEGSKASFGPRPDFETWSRSHQKIEKAEVLHLEETAEKDSSFVVLGFRTYKVTIDLHPSEETRSVPSGENTFFVHLAKGTDGVVRILDIGTGL
jgi:hypothetical protein